MSIDAADGLSARPRPEPDAQSAPYWDAAARHVLTAARCSRCSQFTMPPGPVCRRCGSTKPDFRFVVVSGDGWVRSWTIVRQAMLPGFEVPFVLVDVELADAADVRMIGRLLDGPDATIHLDDAVAVDFEDLGDDLAVPAFRLSAR